MEQTNPVSSDPALRRQVDIALDQLFDLPDAERDGWIERCSLQTPELAGRLTILLGRERGSRALFERLAGHRTDVLERLVPEPGEVSQDPRIGHHYGPWLVQSHLGSGGLAEAYQVQRDDGRYEQQAALKILRSGVIGDHARKLFMRERRLLANLDHPGIVRIIDAGETATGAPWLVMELVEGTPIELHCLAQALPLRARLALMAEAVDVVQAAHGRLVLHGDIKSDHVLVQADGAVRLLDFGIAQALDEDGKGSASEGFSPRVASPEQRTAAALTAASDIYQLGVLLARLCEEQQAGPAVEAIVARASATEPAARYPSASAMAEDLRAVIADQAPAARPDTPPAALWRLVRHHRLVAALAVVVVLGSLGWAVSASLSLAAIERERSLALAAADREKRGKLVLLDLFRRADLLEADSLGMKPEASRAMLDSTLANARARLEDDPAMLAELVGWTARAHQRAGDDQGAIALAREAEALIGNSDGKDSLVHGAAQAYLGDLLMDAGEGEAGMALVARGLALAEGAALTDPALLDLLLSAAWSHEGDWQAQLPLFQRALATARASGSIAGEIEARSGLGRALTGLGELDAARSEIETSLALVKARYGEQHPRIALPLSDLGRLEERSGNSARAAVLHRQAMTVSEAVYGPTNVSSRAHRNNLALALSSAGDAAGASAEFERLLATTPDTAENAMMRAEFAQNLSGVLVRQQRYDEAEAALALAEKTFARLLPADHPRRAFPALTRSGMRLTQRRYGQAESDARFALEHLTRALPAGHFATETARCRLGMALVGQGKTAGGGAMLRQAVAAMEKAASPVPETYLGPCREAAARL